MGSISVIKYMSRKQFILITAIVFVGFVGAFLSGYFLRAYFQNPSYEFPILNQAYNILVNHSYFSLPGSSVLEHGMIRGLLASSEDPYASFQEPVQKELESDSLQGSFGGIGVELTRDAEGNMIIFPIRNGPAFKAGILNGDQLLQVEDLEITPELNVDEITAAIRGPVGQTIKILVTRAGQVEPLTFKIRRELIHLPSVTWHIAPQEKGIGIITVNIIADSTPDEIKEAVEMMQDQGAVHFVLDLRDNGGGLLTAGIDIARLFLSSGVIVQQQYKGEDIETYAVNTPGPLTDLPLVVLINSNTASSAEIVAGALQAHGRATLIGEPSFGKDSIQLIFDLQDGSSLHVTAAKWWIPGLEPPMSEGGIQPDIIISQDDSQLDRAMEAAIEYLRQQ